MNFVSFIYNKIGAERISKAISGAVSAGFGYAVTLGFPEALAGDEIQAAVVIIATYIGTYFAPANTG